MNTELSVTDIVLHYLQLRAAKAALAEKHKQELAPVNADMDTLEAALNSIMLTQGVDSLGTSAGTVYKTTLTSVKVVDWESALDWIRTNDRFDLLERRIAKTALLESEAPCPGLELSRSISINVRRSS